MTKNTPQALPDKEELWAIYIKKNPQWMSDGIHLTHEGLRKFVEQIWLHGYNIWQSAILKEQGNT